MDMNSPHVSVQYLTIPIARAAADWPGIRLAHVSDCHFRRWNRMFQSAQNLLLSLDYDLLVFTGDIGTMIRFWQRAANLALRFFGPLAEHRPICAVLGNHDNPALADASILPMRFLRDEAILWQHDGVVFELAGVEQTHHSQLGHLDRALAGPKPDTFSVLLAHYPSTVFRLPPGRVDLLLCGHTHGGQIRLPRLGCLWPNDRVPRHLARGLNRIGGTYLHVNPGLGASPPLPIRLNCPAEISVLDLVPRSTHTVREDPLGRFDSTNVEARSVPKPNITTGVP
jgi:hypothetical protein